MTEYDEGMFCVEWKALGVCFLDYSRTPNTVPKFTLERIRNTKNSPHPG
jgi:hypothetical protein